MKFKLLFILIGIQISYAQSLYQRDWSTYFGEYDFGDISSCALDSDMNLIISPILSYTNIVKLSNNGNLLWSFAFFNEYLDTEEIHIEDVKTDKAGNIIFCGKTNIDHDIATVGAWQEELGGGFDAVLGKLSPNGELIWCTYLGGEENDRGSIEQSWSSNIEITEDNEILWQTEMLSDGMGTEGVYQTNLGDSKFLLSKFDTNGQKIWATYYGVNENLGIITQMKANEYGIYVAGKTQNSTYYDTFGDTYPENDWMNPEHLFLSKFTLDGNLVWSRYIGGNLDELVFSRNMVLVEKDIYLAGWTRSTNLGTEGSYNPQMAEGQYSSNFLVSVSELGNINWCTYLGEDPDLSSSNSWELTTLSTDGTYIYVAGFTDKTSMIATENAYQPSFAGGFSDNFMMKFDADGVLHYGTYYGGTGDESSLYTFAVPFSGGFYLLGGTNSTSGISTPGSYQENILENISGYNIYIAKFLETQMSTTETNVSTEFLLYPNPAKESVYLQISKPGFLPAKAKVYNALGQIIQEFAITDNITQIYTTQWSKGVYYFELNNGSEIKYNKLILR